MKYIQLYPTRIIEKIRYQLFGTRPTYVGDNIRFSAGDVKVITGDSFMMFPSNQVALIVFEEGNDAAWAEAQREMADAAATHAANQFQNIIQPSIDPIEPPYSPPERAPDPHECM